MKIQIRNTHKILIRAKKTFSSRSVKVAYTALSSFFFTDFIWPTHCDIARRVAIKNPQMKKKGIRKHSHTQINKSTNQQINIYVRNAYTC